LDRIPAIVEIVFARLLERNQAPFTRLLLPIRRNLSNNIRAVRLEREECETDLQTRSFARLMLNVTIFDSDPDLSGKPSLRSKFLLDR